jgi:hypothetical protein
MKYQAIREEIKKLASEQTNLKLQRKTVTFKGIRTVDSADATYLHSKNRYKLRHLYMAYSILRGQERPAPTKGIYYEDETKAYIDKFKEVEEAKAS